MDEGTVLRTVTFFLVDVKFNVVIIKITYFQSLTLSQLLLLNLNLQLKKPDEGTNKDGMNEDSSDSDDLGNNSVDILALYTECSSYLKPGESILKAIKRLGN